MSRSYVPKELRQKVAQQANFRCGYCLTAESIVGYAMDVEHLIPEAAGGLTEESNLWLACSECNGHKTDKTEVINPQSGERTGLFNPRQQVSIEHFEWSAEGDLVIGKTAVGRATLQALQLNRERLVTARRAWVRVGWHPPAQY